MSVEVGLEAGAPDSPLSGCPVQSDSAAVDGRRVVPIVNIHISPIADVTTGPSVAGHFSPKQPIKTEIEGLV